MFVETLEAISTSVSVVELSKQSFPTFKRLFKRLKDGELVIAIFGAGGTGKSTLGKLLSGELENRELFQNYQESTNIETYKLDSDTIGSVIIVPGQERRQDSWDDLLRKVIQGKVSLIINVVSWGYHSFGSLSYQQHRLYQQGMKIEEFLAIYTKDRRHRELNILEKIAPHLSLANTKNKKILFITLVTKQDLWWDHRLQVQAFYQEGDYEAEIAKIRNKLGSLNFIHEYCSTSLVLENFVSGVNELLAPTTQGYDERLKFANLKNFLNTIESFFNISLKAQEEK